MTTAKARLFAKLLTRLEELRITRQIGLRIPRTKGRLLAAAGRTDWLVIALVVHVVTHIVPAVHSAFAAEEGSRLPELFLRGGDQAEIMLRMLEIALLGNRIPGIQQGTPAWIEVIVSSDLARDRAAALPTFHHDCRDVVATAAIRLNRFRLNRFRLEPMKHLEPSFPISSISHSRLPPPREEPAMTSSDDGI